MVRRALLGAILGALFAAHPGQADAGSCKWRPGCPIFEPCTLCDDPFTFFEEEIQEQFEFLLTIGTCVAQKNGEFGRPASFVIEREDFVALTPTEIVERIGPCGTNATPEFIPLRCFRTTKFLYADGSFYARGTRLIFAVDCIVEEDQFVIRLSPFLGSPESPDTITFTVTSVAGRP